MFCLKPLPIEACTKFPEEHPFLQFDFGKNQVNGANVVTFSKKRKTFATYSVKDLKSEHCFLFLWQHTAGRKTFFPGSGQAVAFAGDEGRVLSGGIS